MDPSTTNTEYWQKYVVWFLVANASSALKEAVTMLFVVENNISCKIQWYSWIDSNSVLLGTLTSLRPTDAYMRQ